MVDCPRSHLGEYTHGSKLGKNQCNGNRSSYHLRAARYAISLSKTGLKQGHSLGLDLVHGMVEDGRS